MVFPARIRYDREVVLSARVGGSIRAMPVSNGQMLAPGALVTAIDATPYRIALVRADAEADRAARDAARSRSLLGVGATSQAEVDSAEAAALIALAGKDAARYDLISARVVMPFGGVVLSKTVDVGTTVAPGQPLLSVADLGSPMIARAALPMQDARGIKPGSAAAINVAGRDYVGQVLRIGALAIAANGMIEVDVKLLAPADLISGTVGSVRFAGAASAAGEQHIPAEALVDVKGEFGHVFRVDPRGNFARLTRIHLLGPADDGLRVAGLAAGTRVVTAGAGFLADGQRVTVLSR